MKLYCLLKIQGLTMSIHCPGNLGLRFFSPSYMKNNVCGLPRQNHFVINEKLNIAFIPRSFLPLLVSISDSTNSSTYLSRITESCYASSLLNMCSSFLLSPQIDSTSLLLGCRVFLIFI